MVLTVEQWRKSIKPRRGGRMQFIRRTHLSPLQRVLRIMEQVAVFMRRSRENKLPVAVAEKGSAKRVAGNHRKGIAGLMNIPFLAFRNVRGDGQLVKMPMLVPFNEIKGVHFLIRNTG